MPDAGEVEEARFYLESLIFLPTEIWLGFEAPGEKQARRMSILTAKLAIKYLGKHASDEMKLIGLMLAWSVQQTVTKVFGGLGLGQPNNGSVRTEAPRKNPLDVVSATPTNQIQ